MKFSFQPGRKPSLDTLPPDVINQIALDTVCAPDTPSIRELRTLRSLQLTCGRLYHTLSIKGNPNLYANIFKCMFDVGPVRRRLGRAAVVSSVLSTELVQRLSALQRIKFILHGKGRIDGSEKITYSDWIRLFLMLTEDDGQNRRQLMNVAGILRLPELLFGSTLEGAPLLTKLAKSPLLGLFLALTWLSSEEILTRNDPDHRTGILDFLQPFVLGENTRMDESSALTGVMEDGDFVQTIDYFAHRCQLRVPSTTNFARLCTVALYNAAKPRIQSDERLMPEKTSCSSADFDNDWSRYITVGPHGSLLAGPTIHSEAGSGRSIGTIEGLWEGAWFLPCRIEPTSDIFMCTRPMQCRLREYISFHADESVGFTMGRSSSDESLASAWFPEGVIFDETLESLRVYDPVSERWLSYRPSSEVMNSIECMTERTAVFDTILVGNTEPSHGERHGEYEFHGRVRDEKIALVRRPADPRMDDLGTWVFEGQIHGGREIVGDWRVTSTTADTPAGKGWFHLSKVMVDLGLI